MGPGTIRRRTPFCACSSQAQRVRCVPPMGPGTIRRRTPFCACSLKMRWWLACVFIVSVEAQTPEQSLLDKVKAGVEDNLKRLPDYTYTENIERSLRSSRGKRLRSTDRVRLNVAYVGGKELFGLPGAGRIEHAKIDQLVGEASVTVNLPCSCGVYSSKIAPLSATLAERSSTARQRSVLTTACRLRLAVISSNHRVEKRSSAIAGVFGSLATAST